MFGLRLVNDPAKKVWTWNEDFGFGTRNRIRHSFGSGILYSAWGQLRASLKAPKMLKN